MQEQYYIPKKESTFLALERPIIFFDLETTGKDVRKDRIVELYAVKLHQDGSQTEVYHLINPEMPISKGAVEKHGITEEMIADKPTFSQLASELYTFFCACDLGGYNIKGYDVPLLLEEFHRCKLYPINYNEIKLIDAMGIFHDKEKRDLSAALKFYCERELSNAHSAQADVLATIDILKHQLLRYEDLQPNTSFLHDYLSAGSSVDGSRKFKRNEDGEIVFNFGKHYGKVACKEKDYLKWMLTEGDFAVDTMMVAKKIYKNCIWEEEIDLWLGKNNILKNEAVASALYATIKSGIDVFPFALKDEQGKKVISYLNEPISSYNLVHDDAVKILLNKLDRYLSTAASTTDSAG